MEPAGRVGQEGEVPVVCGYSVAENSGAAHVAEKGHLGRQDRLRVQRDRPKKQDVLALAKQMLYSEVLRQGGALCHRLVQHVQQEDDSAVGQVLVKFRCALILRVDLDELG